MSLNKEIDEFRPPVEYDTGVDYNKTIYDFVGKKGCSYPAEIMRELGIYKDTLYVHLNKLVKENWLKKHNLSGELRIPSWLKPRVNELWSMGLKGDRLKGMAWYTLSEVKDTNVGDTIKSEDVYKKRSLIIDYWMNVHRGVEPSDEQKEASEDGKLDTVGDKIFSDEDVKKLVKKGED